MLMDIDIDNVLSRRTIVFGLKLWILICIGIGAIVILILCFFSSWMTSSKRKKKEKEKEKQREILFSRTRNVAPVSRLASNNQETFKSFNGDSRRDALQDMMQNGLKTREEDHCTSQRLQKALKDHWQNSNGLQPIPKEHSRHGNSSLSNQQGTDLAPFFQENRDVNVSRHEIFPQNRHHGQEIILQENVRDVDLQRPEIFRPDLQVCQEHRNGDPNLATEGLFDPFSREGFWKAQGLAPFRHANGLSPYFGDQYNTRPANGLSRFYQQKWGRYENEVLKQEGLRHAFNTSAKPSSSVGLMNDYAMAGDLRQIVIDRGVDDEHNTRNIREHHNNILGIPSMPEVSHLGWGHWYTLRELEIATNSFSYENVLGEGGYGIVYRGQLPDGTQIAVKNLLNNRGQAEREFKREVTAIGRVRHKNLVRLIGYCMEGSQRLLVYEYIDNGNLEQWLHGGLGDHPPLSWDLRMKIVLGTAKALSYLHEGLEPKVVHRDIKSSNILLDNQWNPKVADFGLAKLLGTENHVTTRVMGTFGYVAPEYALSGMLTEKSDVYSYGVLLMEVVTGRVPVDFSRAAGEVNLVEWFKSMVCKHHSEQVLDPKMDVKPPLRTLMRVLVVAVRCVDSDASKRPKMGQVLNLLEDDDYPFQEMNRKNALDSLGRNTNTPADTSTSSQAQNSFERVDSNPIEVTYWKVDANGKSKASSREQHEDASRSEVRGPGCEED